jgi:plasmid stability protein
VRHITVSVDDETYRRARVKAAKQGTSVSALVRRFLTELAATESDAERLQREERALRARIRVFSAVNRLGHEDVHARGA